MKRKLYYHLICLLFSFLTYAQQNIEFIHITAEQGLSQNDINSICQDNKGFIWLSSHDGLNKYDGYSFKTYRPDPENENSIPSNLIHDIIPDNDGFIWMVNTNMGISRFNPADETVERFISDSKNENSLSTNIVSSLYVDPQNRLWVSNDNGVDVLDINKLPENVDFVHYTVNPNDPNAPENRVKVVFQDSNEQIWLGTDSGLFKAFMNSKGQMTFINVSEEQGLWKKVRVNSIIEDKNGGLVLSSIFGLHYKKSPAEKFELVKKEVYYHLGIDKLNNLWAGGPEGLSYFEYNSLQSKFIFKNNFTNDIRNPKSINKNSVRDLFVDRSNVIWIGTKGGGVNKMYPAGNPFFTAQNNLSPNSLSYNNIRSLFQDSNGNLWVGTEDGSLNVSINNKNNPKYNEFKSFENLVNIFAIHEVKLRDGKYVLFGSETNTEFKAVKLKEGGYTKNDFKILGERIGAIFSIQQTKNSAIWIGTYNKGVFRWVQQPDGTFEKSHFPEGSGGLSSRTIRSFLEDAEGNLWIGTANGLNFLPKAELLKEQPKFKVFKNEKDNPKSISHNYILAIHQSINGTIWVGTLGGGLNKVINRDQNFEFSFQKSSVKNGLANNIIKAIEEDDKGNLWIASNKGLTKYNPNSQKVRNYDVNDGLQGNEFLELSSFKLNNGELAFGGINGFNTFNPATIEDNTEKAQPLLTNFYLLNKKVDVGQELNGRVVLNKTINETEEVVLKPNENSFSLEFSAAHYVAPKKNKFKYKLEGFDEDWIDTNAEKRFATYTNLPSGKYKFLLKTSNNDGLWSEENKMLEIEVVPPFWKTGVAYFLYGLIAIGLLVGFRRYTIVRAEEKHQFDVSKMEKEKSEELQQMKLEFFTNISHEFRTPLTLIKGPLDYLEKNEEELNSEERKKQYDLMSKNANYLLRLVNQLLDFRRLDRKKMQLNFSKLNIVEFIEETSGPFLFMANKKQIDFNVIATHKNIEVSFDPDALEKIMNNLLFNAFKFTPEQHKISVIIHTGSSFENPNVFNKKLDLSKYVVIQIKDTGKGIPAEKLEHIFERYYVERKKNIQGAGIGLSFTKSLVELHDGFINVESAEGKGTTFSVLLPVKNNENANGKIIDLENELQEEHLSNLAPDLQTLTGELKADFEKSKTQKEEENKLPKILLIEDNEDIREFIKQGLGEKYEIVEAENGEEGLQKAIEELPSLIVSDIMMPKLDGLAMSKQLREDKKTSHIPIVLLTAKSSTDTEREALGIGIEDFIRKPFDLDVLVLKIQNIISKRESIRNKYKTTVSLEPSEIAVTSVDEKFLKQAMAIVEDHMMNTEFSVEMLVAEMGMSRSNLYLKLKEITGLSSSEFIRSVRLKRAVQLIKKSDMSVKEIMYMTGFNTASYFSKCFKKQYGMVPSEYVKSLKKEKADLKGLLEQE